jgi:hypothetical protein
MLFKKRFPESPRDSSFREQLADANDIIDYGHMNCLKDSRIEARDSYKQALEIYNDLFTGPHRHALEDNPVFHEDFARLYTVLDIIDNEDTYILYDGAMFHFNAAAEIYEQENDFKRVGTIRHAQAAFLRSYGEDEKAETHEGEATTMDLLSKGSANTAEAKKKIKLASQATEEFDRITPEQLKEYDRNKAKEEKKKSLPKKIGLMVSALTLPKQSFKSSRKTGK